MENIVNEPALKYNYITEEQYLTAERIAVDKHEYYQGEIFAMSGALLNHNKIFSNLFTAIGSKLKGSSSKPYGSDLRIHIPKNTLYTYPDISIICGEVNLTDDNLDTATNPSIIIEILSKSTRNYDRIEKFSLYQEIETFQEYILVDSRKLHVMKYKRNDDNSWHLTNYRSIENTFIISSVNITVSLKDIYEGLSFE